MAAAVAEFKKTIDRYRLAQKEFVKGNLGRSRKFVHMQTMSPSWEDGAVSKKAGSTKLRNATTGHRRVC